MIINGKTLDEHADDAEGRKPVTDDEFSAAEKSMGLEGVRHGREAASWLLDGNSTKEDAQGLLEKIENCELDSPSPLSGEWADAPTLDELIDENTELVGELLTDGERDCLAVAYECGFAEGYQMEAERIARFYAKD
jgi:hypothetical protein